MTAADLGFLARFAIDLRRHREAVKYLSQLIDLNPALDDNDRQTFQSCFKRAVDDHRKNLRLFEQRLIDQEGNAPALDRLTSLREKELNDLTTLTNEACALIDGKLLPNASTPSALAFFKKMRGDLARYLCEFTAGEALQEAKVDAESAYSAAIAVAERDLAPTDPVRLGAILNYAVFTYEHRELFQDAVDLIQAAISAALGEGNELAPDVKQEAREIIDVMTQNLETWGNAVKDDSEDES
jgi:tetratricopeptide (TPR) repeat protein